MIQDATQILNLLLEGGQSIVAGRLAGAFRNINKDHIADDILSILGKAGYDVRELDPFDNKIIVLLSTSDQSPYGNRIRLMWQQMRGKVLKYFPKEPGIPKNKKGYMKLVAEIYVTNAYHSLSIEKYHVTPELIEKVRKGVWNLQDNEDDRKQRDAMAAKGYWEALQAVERHWPCDGWKKCRISSG